MIRDIAPTATREVDGNWQEWVLGRWYDWSERPLCSCTIEDHGDGESGPCPVIVEHSEECERHNVRHGEGCAVLGQRESLRREIALAPGLEELEGAWVEYFGLGDQEVEECTCGAVEAALREPSLAESQ